MPQALPFVNHWLPPLFVAALWLLSRGCPHALVDQPEVNGPRLDRRQMDRVDKLVLETMRKYRLPGIAVGIAGKDSLLYTRGYGWANLKEHIPVTERSLFHTASISKLFTAQAIMQLVSESRLRLEDRVVDLIPALKSEDPAFSEVTVRHLLNHTSGLPDIYNYRWQRYHTEESSLERYLLAESWRLDAPPGTVFAYSNLGYDLLGYLVEAGAHQAFEEYVAEQILRPAGMITSDFRHYLLPDALRVQPYTRTWTGAVRPRKVYPYTREHAPSSTLNASAQELAIWMGKILGERSEEGKTGFWSDMMAASTPLTDDIGLGFQRYEIDGARAVGHFGGDRGFRSFLVMVPERKIGVVVLGNCDYAEDFRQEIAWGIIDILGE
jgi:CubicO group peptidase (beta-lactamase class C family)